MLTYRSISLMGACDRQGRREHASQIAFLRHQMRLRFLVVVAVGFAGLACSGTVAAITDKTSYRIGETMRVRVENRSHKDVRVPDATQPVTFERYEGSAWIARPQVDSGNTIQMVVRMLRPGRTREFDVRIGSELPEGEYRVVFGTAWQSNSFWIHVSVDGSNNAN